jgi:hypothetical protein
LGLFGGIVCRDRWFLHVYIFVSSLWGLIMEYKILLGLVCALLLVAFSVGALALALGIGSVIVSLCTVSVTGVGLFVVSGLLGE